MKHIVRKAYWDFEKEERWLNEMSARGMAFTDYSWCRYVFADAPNNQYIYRIELLENPPTHPESIAYLRFLEENGIECVATYMRWVYLRKPVSEGPFDLYTDLDSKIKHYQRINRLWTFFMCIEFGAALSNLSIWITNWNIDAHPANPQGVNLVFGCLLLFFGFLFFGLGVPIRRKIKKLRQEKVIRE